MVAAGFVLAVGRGRRMGRDKTMLPYRGRPPIAHVAETVEKALYGSGHAAIVGQPDRIAFEEHHG
jgi:molybdopterin-guanine dinucleotide biosynthesis protein A